MKRMLIAAALFAASPVFAAEIANLKIVTDASPDYSDMESMVRSITKNWESDEQKMYALFYWDHIARRQTSPQYMHGYELTDPIRQYNDYGFTMCSTISGIKCSTWNYMGYPCRFFEIGIHTVPDVWYEGRFHHYDNSLSAMYTLCDGKTIAAVDEIGRKIGCEASGGQAEIGHIAIYHCLTGTSVDGYLEGADTERTLRHLGDTSFHPNNIKYQFQYYSQGRGHRYSLNLSQGETYTRYYSRQDLGSPNAVPQKSEEGNYKADPAYFVPNRGEAGTGKGRDPEASNPRYHIRANGERTFTPVLDEAHLAGALHSGSNLKATPEGLVAADPARPGEAVFKVEGGNVICSMKIHAEAKGDPDFTISTTNGLHWKELPKVNNEKGILNWKLIDEVNESYEVLVKVAIKPGEVLKAISFNTITQVNGKTQPQLKLGRNTVYVGVGEQTNTIMLWPDFRSVKELVHESQNIRNASNQKQMIAQQDPSKEAFITYKVDAPTDITSVTYGGRLCNRGDKNHIDYLHSFDGGKTWKQSWSCTDNKAPWDIIHYETITDIPAGTRSVLFKYSLNGNAAAAPVEQKGDEAYQPETCALYDVHMEVNHKLQATTKEPLEVTFAWRERLADYTTIKRSHKQLVDKLPFTYNIDVAGDDHPIVESLTVNLRQPTRGDTLYGYSDTRKGATEKFVGKWATYGKNLALHKPYTTTIPSDTQWDAGDPDLKKLTDGRVGSTYNGGGNYREGGIWKPKDNPEFTIDLGKVEKCAAFRIHTLGYEGQEPMLGLNKDNVEVLVSTDGKEFTSAGKFDFRLYWKDIPVNMMWNDEESFKAYNFMLPMPAPVEARYVKYKVTGNERYLGISELQVLESFKMEPFDLRIALPDPAQNGKAPPKPDLSPNAKKWTDAERPQNIIGVRAKRKD